MFVTAHEKCTEQDTDTAVLPFTPVNFKPKKEF